MIRLSQQKVNEILSKAQPVLRKQAEEIVVPAVTKTVRRFVATDARAAALGSMFSWAALGGAQYLRDLPQEIIETFGTPEDFVYTLCDHVLEVHGDLFKQFVEQLDAIRIPWKGKVKPSLLVENTDGIASSPRGAAPRNDTVDAAPRNDKITPVSQAPEPEVVAFEQKGLRHQDAGDRLAIRVRMIEQLAGIKFNDTNLEERFRHVIRPALKGVKDLEEARRQLALTEDKGGVGMGHDQVEEVIGLLERLHAKDRELEARAAVAKLEPPKSMLPMVEEPMVPAVQHDVILEAARSAADRIQPNQGMDSIARRGGSLQNDNGRKLDQLIRQSAADQPMDLQRKMHDVIARPISMGPVEELRTTNLTDFRRLAAKAGAAADKIRQKLAVLREDGIDRYAAGIKAWRESPVYGVYTKMIRDGLVEGRTVEDLAASDTSDPERLSGEELQAVIELNKSLRF